MFPGPDCQNMVLGKVQAPGDFDPSSVRIRAAAMNRPAMRWTEGGGWRLPPVPEVESGAQLQLQCRSVDHFSDGQVPIAAHGGKSAPANRGAIAQR